MHVIRRDTLGTNNGVWTRASARLQNTMRADRSYEIADRSFFLNIYTQQLSG